MQIIERFLICLTAASLALSLSACGSIMGDEGIFRDRSEDYKQAPQVAPVELPEGIKSTEMEDIYVIPPVEDSYLPADEFEVPRPAPLGNSAAQEIVRIQRLGDDSWILVGVAPGQVWPQVRNFMSASGMQVDAPNLAPAPSNAHQALGVSEQATDDEIRNAFVAFAQAYNPDRLASLNLPAEAAQFCEEKYRAISAAYAQLTEGKTPALT